MSDRKWTEEQLAAIEKRGNNLLVSAGAGSGKTAVLIERIIRRITDKEEPLNIDEMLVVTFTNSAAEEMRQRLAEALDKLIEKEPLDKHLLAQAGLLEQAYITTLHSFCLDLIRKNYYRLDLDASFRVAADMERQLLYRDVMDSFLEDEYQKGNPLLPVLADSYGGNKDDSGLKALIGGLFAFAVCQPYPQKWLEEASDVFSCSNFEAYPWSGFWGQEIRNKIAEVIDYLDIAIKDACFPDIPKAWQDCFTAEKAELLSYCSESSGLAGLMDRLNAYRFERLPSSKKDPGDKEAKENCRKQRDQAKKLFNIAKKQFFPRRSDELLEALQQIAEPMKALKELAWGYASALAEEKRRRSLIDYSDMEHFCLRLLEDQSNGVREELAKAFREVLVDEYQDINGVQNRILELLAGKGNFFMVGDIKQSIYGFRLAEPQFFLDKYSDFKSCNGGEAIDLRTNFRSTASVISAVNFVFGQLMTKGSAGIDYDDSARLRAGREEEGAATEVYLLNYLTDKDKRELRENRAEESDMETENGDMGEAEPYLPFEENAKIKLEARFIAGKILQMKKSGYDFRDIVILLRSLKNKERGYLKELSIFGIPVQGGDGDNAPGRAEIELMISLLKVIDNPLQDIPLAAVLYSPIVGLDLDAMLQLRSKNSLSLYEALKEFSLSGDEDYGKAVAFLNNLYDWRRKSKEYPVAELLQTIFEDSGFYYLAGALPGGENRQKNLREFYDLARDYDQSAYKGLFRFVRQIEDIREKGQEIIGGRPLADNENTVRIMSIHKSKGLEFPVVFLAGLGDNFNLRANNSDMLFHQEFLWGPKIANREQRIKYPTLAYQVINYQKRRQALAEEMRILYVAMTRARERLIMSAAVRKLDEAAEKWKTAPDTGWSFLPAIIGADSKYIDWLGRALIRHPHAEPLRELLEDASGIKILDTECILKLEVIDNCQPVLLDTTGQEAESSVEKHEAEQADGVVPDAELENILGYRYPYGACEYPAKWTVTEIQKSVYPPEQIADSVYLYIDDEDQHNKDEVLQRGILWHLILEKLDFQDVIDRDALRRQLEGLVKKGFISGDDLAVLDIDTLERFVSSALGRRVQNSKRTLKELAFTYALPADELDISASSEDRIILQGMIDLVFEEKDGWVIIDYKTGGRSLEDKVLAKKYRSQLDYYCRAFKAMSGEPVKEACLFMLDDGRAISLK